MLLKDKVAIVTGASRGLGRAYAEAMHYFLTNPEGTAHVVTKYTLVADREVLAYSIDNPRAGEACDYHSGFGC